MSTPLPTPSLTCNQSNLTFEFVGSSLVDTLPTGCTTGPKFQGAVLGLDRNFYLIPDGARYVTKFDPGTDTTVNQFADLGAIDPSLCEQSCKYAGGVLEPNSGKIYANPNKAITGPLVIDTCVSPATVSQSYFSDCNSRCCLQTAGGVIGGTGTSECLFMVPFTGPAKVRTMCTCTDSFGADLPFPETPTSGPIHSIRNTAADEGVVEDVYRRFCGATDGGNDKIYATPMSSESILIIDTTCPDSCADKVTFGDCIITGCLTPTAAPIDSSTKDLEPFPFFNMYSGGSLASNNAIYAMPNRANAVLKIDTSDDTTTEIPLPPALIDAIDEYETELPAGNFASKSLSSVLGPGGCVFSVPVNAPYLIWVDPSTDVVSYREINSELGETGTDCNYFSSAATIGNCIYYFPQEADKILKIRTNNISASPTPTPTVSFTQTGTAPLAATATPTNSNSPSCSAPLPPTPPASFTPPATQGCQTPTIGNCTPVPTNPFTTPCATNTPTFTPTLTPPAPSVTSSITPSTSKIIAVTQSNTATKTGTPTGTPTVTPTRSLPIGVTPSNTATQTVTPTAKVTSTPTQTGTPSHTPTISNSPTLTFERCVTLRYNVVDGPDRFIVSYEGEVVLDTGFIGHSSYNFSGSKRQLFIDALLAEGFEANNFPGLSLAADGFPNVNNTTSGSSMIRVAYFEEDESIVTIQSPVHDKPQWTYTLECPVICPSQTPTPTNTPTKSGTPTNTPTKSGTPTNTPTKSGTPTQTNTGTPTKTGTPTTTVTPFPTPPNSPSKTQTPTVTPTGTFVASATPTPSKTGTPTQTPTTTPTPVVTPTNTSTPIATPPNTATKTGTPTGTPTNTATNTQTPTASCSSGICPTPTNTGTAGVTSTPTKTGTPTNTATPTNTPTVTPTVTGTPAVTPPISYTPTNQ